MIEEWCQDVRKHLKDSDDENAHDHPLPYLLRQGRFHDLSEEQADRSNDGHHDDGRPDCEAFAEHAFVHSPPPQSVRRLQTHRIHIRLPLLEAERLVECVGIRARGVRGEAKVDGREFASSEVDDALQERAADPLAPIGRQDHDILNTRLAASRRLKDTQGGASDNMLFIVLRDEDPRSRRRHRTLLLQRSHRDVRVQLLHKSQQISDLGLGQST